MQSRKGIKWWVWALWGVCVGQALYIYLSAPSRPEPTKVVSITRVGDGGAIYEVLYDSGGATVPFVYRYFLMGVKSTDEDALLESKTSEPFLVTRSTQAVREVSEGKVKLKTDKAIYAFHSSSLFKVNGEINVVTFDLDSVTP